MKKSILIFALLYGRVLSLCIIFRCIANKLIWILIIITFMNENLKPVKNIGRTKVTIICNKIKSSMQAVQARWGQDGMFRS